MLAEHDKSLIYKLFECSPSQHLSCLKKLSYHESFVLFYQCKNLYNPDNWLCRAIQAVLVRFDAASVLKIHSHQSRSLLHVFLPAASSVLVLQKKMLSKIRIFLS